MLALIINGNWAAQVLAGTKTVELRAWKLPACAVGAKVGLLAPATPGTPGAPPALPPGLGPATPAALVGWAVFGEPFQYEGPDAAAADRPRHAVPADSPFLKGRELWGWPVLAVGRAHAPTTGLPRGVRLLRSLWAMDESIVCCVE